MCPSVSRIIIWATTRRIQEFVRTSPFEGTFAENLIADEPTNRMTGRGSHGPDGGSSARPQGPRGGSSTPASRLWMPSRGREPEIARRGPLRNCRRRWPNPAALRRHGRSGCMKVYWTRHVGRGNRWQPISATKRLTAGRIRRTARSPCRGSTGALADPFDLHAEWEIVGQTSSFCPEAPHLRDMCPQ